MTKITEWFSENTIDQYKKLFTDIFPVTKTNKRIKSEKLSVLEVNFNEYLAFSGNLKNDVIFIDIDNKEGNNKGTKEWKKLLIELELDEELALEKIDTLVHKTKNNGYHIFFKLPIGCDKDALTNKISKNVEVKKKESYLANSTITSKGNTGRYSVYRDQTVLEIPNALLMVLFSTKQITKKNNSTENFQILQEDIKGDNTVNWEDITYDDLKIKMDTLVPEVEFAKWQRQMYLFMTVYFHLKNLGKEMDTTCEDFLIHWSSKGINRGPDDRKKIIGMVSSFNLEANLDSLLPENNYLITNYDNSTFLESLAKSVANNVSKMREDLRPASTIRNYVDAHMDALASAFVKDVMANRECFILDQDYKSKIYTFYTFTINNRWEKIVSNAASKSTREILQLLPIYGILTYDGKTLYSNNLRNYISTILGGEDFVNKFGQVLSLKLTTSLYGLDLSSRDFPFNCDIFGFRNVAIKVTKSPFSFKVISWEQVRSLRLRGEIVISTESLDTQAFGDFLKKSVQFDPLILVEDASRIENDLFCLFAPLFWDFTVELPLNFCNTDEQIKEYREEILLRTKDRMKTFFHLIGKSMLRYKGNIVPFCFLVSGSEKIRNLNGANGKTFLGQYLLTSLFGKIRVTLSGSTNSTENKDKFTEASMKDALLQIVDDLPDTGKYNKVSIKHYIKAVGERYVKVRSMNSEPKDAKLLFDTIVIANNIDRNIGSDGGNQRRILFMEMHNANKINVIKEYSDTGDILNTHEHQFDGFSTTNEKETQQYYCNKFLNEVYRNFFSLDIVKKIMESSNFADNIYFTYLTALGNIFIGSQAEILSAEQISLKSKLFYYSIKGGNELIQKGSPNHLKGLTPFVVEDKSSPLFNLLAKTFKFEDKVTFDEETLGLLVTRSVLNRMIKYYVLTDTEEHSDEIDRFVQQVKGTFITLPDTYESLELIALTRMDLGNIYKQIASSDNTNISCKVNTKTYTELIKLVEFSIAGSPYRESSNTQKENIMELIKIFGIDNNEKLISLNLKHKESDIRNNWLRLYR